MVYLLLALVFYTAAIMVGTSAARNANTNLVSALGNLVSAILPIAIVIPVLAKKTFHSQKYGLWMAVLGGFLVSIFVLLLNKSFTQNKVGIVVPVVYGGSILLSTILSILIFKEKVTAVEAFGLSFVLVGIVIIIYARATTQ